MEIKFIAEQSVEYSAQLFTMKEVKPMHDCENLVMVDVGDNVIINKNFVKQGGLFLFIPRESRLNSTFLKENNLYRDATKNADKTKTGYIENNGRVKTIKLRGHLSCGLITDANALTKWIVAGIKNMGYDPDAITIAEIESCVQMQMKPFSAVSVEYGSKTRTLYLLEPYIPEDNRELRFHGHKKKPVAVEGFKYHYDTEPVRRAILNGLVVENTCIGVSVKLHGTSIILANLPKLRFCPKWLSRFLPKRHKQIVASRTMQRENDGSLWGEVNKLVSVPKGYTVYAELVGYDLTNPTKLIQKQYDYGCNVGECKMFVYRATYTDNGITKELGTTETMKLTETIAMGVKHNKFSVHMVERDMIQVDDNFNETLEIVKEIFNIDGKEPLCRNDVPREGVVIIINDDTSKAFKLKSEAFLCREGALVTQYDKNQS